MNSRNNLHRTPQWQLADRQRYLSELEALGERVRADVRRLRQEIEEARIPEQNSERGGGRAEFWPKKPVAVSSGSSGGLFSYVMRAWRVPARGGAMDASPAPELETSGGVATRSGS